MEADSPARSGAEAISGWTLRLLGPFDLTVRATGARVALPGKRERVLLAYFALSPNCRTRRRKVAALLWGDATDETSLDNLRVCVWSLRKALGDVQHRIIVSDGEDIVLDHSSFEIDVLKFRQFAASTERTELQAAAKLYAVEFL